MVTVANGRGAETLTVLTVQGKTLTVVREPACTNGGNGNGTNGTNGGQVTVG